MNILQVVTYGLQKLENKFIFWYFWKDALFKGMERTGFQGFLKIVYNIKLEQNSLDLNDTYSLETSESSCVEYVSNQATVGSR